MQEQLQIKGLKTWATHEGGGYQYTLYRNNKKVAFVHEAGDGGMLDVQWFDPQTKEDITEFVKTLPKIQMEDMDLSFNVTVDIFLDDLVAKYEWEKKLAKHRKQGILFRLLSDPKESFRTIKTLDLGVAKSYLDKHYPNGYVLV